MRTPASSENLYKWAPVSTTRYVTRPESKSAFDSKIASVMKGRRTCGLSLALTAAFTPT